MYENWSMDQNLDKKNCEKFYWAFVNITIIVIILNLALLYYLIDFFMC